MENPKLSFVLYFDNYPMLLSLPPEQRGWLLTAVFDYAQRIAQDPGADIPQVLEGYPQLTPQAQTACFSVCLNIARDTRRWQNRQQAALRRRQEGRGGALPLQIPDAPASPAARQDNESLRQLVEELRAQEKPGDSLPPWRRREQEGGR